MIATVRNASKPSRKTMMSAWSMDSLSQSGRRDHLHAIGRVGELAFAPAGVADAENLKVVEGGGELLLLADRELQPLELLVVKLDHAAADRADQVVVVRVPGDVLVVIVILAEVDAADHARL